MDTKDSNPKQAFGDAKIPVALVPEIAIAEESLAFLDGMLKYGFVNWRAIGVRTSTYVNAAKRHLGLYWGGEDRDPVTRVRHLAYARACLGILIDAELHDMLTDDRPIGEAFNDRALKDLMPTVEHLRQLHAGKDPHHYTRDNAPTATGRTDRTVSPEAIDAQLGAEGDACDCPSCRTSGIGIAYCNPFAAVVR